MCDLTPMNIQRPIKEKSWTVDEVKVIAKWSGKKILSEITVLVNAVGGNLRTDDQVERKGQRQGFSFRVKS